MSFYCCFPEPNSYKRKESRQGQTFHHFSVNSKIRCEWTKKRLLCARPTGPRFGITIVTRMKKVNYAELHLPRKSDFGARNDVPFVIHYGYCCAPAAALCLYTNCLEPNLDRQMATCQHLVDEINIYRPNSQRWVIFMSVMDDWDMKATIKESYILLTLFAELLYIAIIKMCTQIKTIKEKR